MFIGRRTTHVLSTARLMFIGRRTAHALSTARFVFIAHALSTARFMFIGLQLVDASQRVAPETLDGCHWSTTGAGCDDATSCSEQPHSERAYRTCQE
jgi:hypothetical protein